MVKLSKAAVRKFLDRPRDNHNAWRKLTRRKLNALKRDQLVAKPPIWKKLSKTQRACLLLGGIHKKFAFFLDTGCGKTLLSIALAKYLRRAHKARRFLVLVPNLINVAEWAEECEKHAPKMKITLLEEDTGSKWDDLQNTDSLLYITTYLGFTRMVTIPQKNKKGKVELVQDEKAIRAAVKSIDGLILDESTLVGNHNSLFYLVCKKVMNRLKYGWLLTGTPFGKDVTKLWAQMFIVDRGASLGETLALFRAAFFSEVENPFSNWPDYVFQKKNTKTVRKFVSHRSIRVEVDQADLPRLVSVTKPILMSPDAIAYFDPLKEQLEEAIRDGVSAGERQLVKNYFLRMRQISSGFIGYDDDELGTKAKLIFDKNPKLDMVRGVVESLPRKSKFIIYCEYVVSGEILCSMLDDLGIRHGWIYGKTKDPRDVRRQFYADPDMRGIVLNNSCGGFGLNLQIAKYGLYYETPVDPIMRKQTRRRIERQYSKHDKVVFYDFPVRKTYDFRILESLKADEDFFDSIMSTRLED